MKKTAALCFIFILLMVALAAGSWAVIPQAINFQGVVKKMGGNLTIGPNAYMQISFFDNKDKAGAPLWVSKSYAIPADATIDPNGFFSLSLSGGTPDLASLPFDIPYYVNVHFSDGVGNPEDFYDSSKKLAPLASAPYAFRAQVAESLPGITVSKGNVGIGTTSPGVLLQVGAPGPLFGGEKIVADGVICGTGTGADNTKALVFQGGASPKISAFDYTIVGGQYVGGMPLHLNQDNSNIYMCENGGKVGIGMQTPQSGLDVLDTSSSVAMHAKGNRGAYFEGTQSSGGYGVHGVGYGGASGGEFYSAAGIGLNVSTGSNAKAAIVANNSSGGPAIVATGNVGIGTASPADKLQVSGGNALFDGKVGIGTTEPGAPLEIGAAGEGLRIISKTAGNTHIGWNGTDDYLSYASTGKVHFRTFDGTNYSEKVVVDSSGKVGIGVSAPDFKLDVRNTGTDYTIFANGNGDVLRASCLSPGKTAIDAITDSGGKGLYAFGGDIGVEGAGLKYSFFASGSGQAYGSASSIRWKENIKPIDDPLNKVLKLKGVYFDWKKDHGGQHSIGMIAEDVGKVIPEVVSYEKDGSGYATGMDYSRLTPLLIEAVKVQQKTIDKQQAQLEKQQQEIDALKAKIK